MKKPIIINIVDGCVSDVLNVPKGIKVEIRDYDAPDVADIDELNGEPYNDNLTFLKDDDGEWYELFVY